MQLHHASGERQPEPGALARLLGLMTGLLELLEDPLLILRRDADAGVVHGEADPAVLAVRAQAHPPPVPPQSRALPHILHDPPPPLPLAPHAPQPLRPSPPHSPPQP